MDKRLSNFLDFSLSFLIGLVFSGVTVAIFSELKYLLEQGKLSNISEVLSFFDESFSGESVQPTTGVQVSEISGRVEAEEEAVRERRVFRESSEGVGYEGVGHSSVYFEEE